MGTRRIAGSVTGMSGILITVAHLIAVLFSDLQEQYHGHETLVAIGFAPTVLGLLLIGTDKQQ